MVHGRRLEQEAHRLRDLDRRHDLGQGRQGHRAGGSGRQRQHRSSARSRRPSGRAASALLDAADRPQARRRRRLPDEDHGHDVDRRDRLGGAEPGAEPVRLEPELRLLEPELARRAPGPRHVLRRTSSTTRATRSTPTATSTRASGWRPRATAARSTRSTARRRAARCSTSARGHRLRRAGRPPASRSRRRPERRRSSSASTGARAAATSSRASARRPRPTAAPGRRFPSRRADGGALFGLGNQAAFDNGGERDPSVALRRRDLRPLLHGARLRRRRSIGFASTPEDAATKQPDNAAGRPGARCCPATDPASTRAAWPPVGDQGRRDLRHVLRGPGLERRPKIGRATSATANGPFTRAEAPVLDVGAAGPSSTPRA